MKKELSNYLGIDLETINLLFDNYLIDPKSVTRFLIMKEYEEIKSKEPSRSNTDIYLELADKYRVCESSIYKWIKLYSL
jgi:hypothetical protein